MLKVRPCFDRMDDFDGFVFTAAALALIDIPDIDAEQIVRKAMKIAGDICVYTNYNIIVEKIEPKTLPSQELNK